MGDVAKPTPGSADLRSGTPEGESITLLQHPLLVVLVHGIGPQNKPGQMAFLNRLREATAQRLKDEGKDGLASRLVTERADWSTAFPKRADWLRNLFPDQANKFILFKRILAVVAWFVPAVVIAALGTAAGMLWFHPIQLGWMLVTGWVLGTAVGVIGALAVAWWVILPNFPWGHLWTFGRPFEADSVSDIILYGSDKPRRKMQGIVLKTIEPYLPLKYAIGDGASECLPVVFIGHSLGSVVVYDLLLGIARRMKRMKNIAAGPTAVERELATVKQQLSRHREAVAAGGTNDRPSEDASLEGTLAFLQRADAIETSLCPVGMITMGSPISFFLFRKPDILDRTNLWQEACPLPFQPTGALGALRWRWQNFWHPTDVVAHRLEPLFNEGYPPSGGKSKFVDDVKTHAWARGPVSAHETYWTNPAVLKFASEHLADVIVNLP